VIAGDAVVPRAAVSLLLALALASCSLPDLNLTTTDPIKVDVNVRLDVYQYSKADPIKASQTGGQSVDSVLARQRNRSGEVQTLKNSRLVGENHRALLTIREQPAGKDGEWVKKTVQNENDDRVFLMVEMAKKENLQMHEVQEREWKINIDRAFPGEWIEVPGDKEGIFKWVAKAKK
jgi:uncharacterized protein